MLNFVEEVLKLAKIHQDLNEKDKKKAMEIEGKMKLQPIDSLHLISAESAKVDFLITCDYNLVKKYKGNLKVIAPLDFIKFYENHYH